MGSDEFLAHHYVPVREFPFGNRHSLFVPVRFPQIFAFERAREGDLAFRSTTDRADVALNSGAVTAGTAFAAYFAEYRFGHRLLAIIESAPMQRVDLYIKVTVDLEEDEKAERIAAEICRQIEKLYVVRSAELSSTVVRE